MITMEILGKIRRMYLRDKLSLHEITKRTGLPRNTIRSWLRKSEDEAAPPEPAMRQALHLCVVERFDPLKPFGGARRALHRT